MNKSLFRAYVLRFVSLSIVVTLFFGCSNDDYSDKNVAPMEQYAFSTELEQDLQTFAMNHAEVVNDILANRFTLDGTRSVSRSNELYDRLENNILNINRKYDLYADLPEEKNKPCVSEDSVAMMQMDHDMFLSYIKKNKSLEYYRIYKDVLERGYLDLTADAIIANKKLHLNEKYSLLLAIPAMGQANLFARTMLKTTREVTESSKCLDAYQNDRYWCGFYYGVSCGLSCTGGVLIAGIGILWATDQLDKCLDSARNTYINCQRLEGLK